MLDDLRRMGVTGRTVQLERDVTSSVTSSSPSWPRLNELAQERLEELGDYAGAS